MTRFRKMPGDPEDATNKLKSETGRRPFLTVPRPQTGEEGATDV